MGIYIEGFSKPRFMMWKEVTETEPEDNESVLFIFKNNFAVGWRDCGFYMIWTGGDMYTELYGHEEKPWAWMPLPKLPKEGETGWKN